MNASEGFVAVLFADVADSVHLYDIFGDARAKLAVDECLAAMRFVVDQYGGQVVKTIGDELMCVLPDADKACLTGNDMQLRTLALPALEGHQRAIRVGFHAGLVIRENGDVFGDTVNLAARMTRLAKAGQIITTRVTAELLSPVLRGAIRRVAAVSIKGKDEHVDVVEVVWQAGDEMTLVASTSPMLARPMRLDLACGDTRVVMDASVSRVVMGRDASCHLVVQDLKASRQHACIELRQGKFFLMDQSTNGTFVWFDDQSRVVLRREEMMLQRSGWIAFGSAVDDIRNIVVSDVVRFCLDS